MTTGSDAGAAATAGTGGALRRLLGVRYATAERFSAPIVAEGWGDGEHGEHGEHGPAPFQIEDPNQPLGAEPREDCHVLNIWAPSEISSPLPVYVAIYGGGFEHGSASSWPLNGSTLAATGEMIVVSVNYRVGALGFMTLAAASTPGIAQAFPEASNLGLRDVIAALAWIQRHIADVGGDPSQVTVVGESAGGFLTAALPAAPSARGLYRRLGVFSAGASRILPLAHAAEMADGFLTALGDDVSPDVLRNCPPEETVHAQAQVVLTDIGLRNGPRPGALGVVDDHELPQGVLASHPVEAFASGKAAGTPLLVSTTQDEIALFRQLMGAPFDPPDLRSISDQLRSFDITSERADEIVADYAAGIAGGDAEPGAVRADVLTDYIYRLAAVRLAAAHAEGGGSAHLMLIGGADGELAGHAVDVPALMGLHWPGASAAARRRDGEITKALTDHVLGRRHEWDPVRHDRLSAAGVGELREPAEEVFARIASRWEGVPRP